MNNIVKDIKSEQIEQDNNYVMHIEEIGNKTIKLIKFVNSQGQIQQFKEFNGEGFNKRLKSCFFGAPKVYNGFTIIDDEVLFASGYICKMKYLAQLYEKVIDDTKEDIVTAINISREQLKRHI